MNKEIIDIIQWTLIFICLGRTYYLRKDLSTLYEIIKALKGSNK